MIIIIRFAAQLLSIIIGAQLLLFFLLLSMLESVKTLMLFWIIKNFSEQHLFEMQIFFLYLCNDSDYRKLKFSSGIHFTINTVYNENYFKL